MNISSTGKLPKLIGTAALILLAAILSGPAELELRGATTTPDPLSLVIIQGNDLQTISKLVEAVGGRVIHELAIISALEAKLTAEQQRALESQDPLLELFPNDGVSTAGFMWTELNVSPGEHAKLLIRSIGLRIPHTLKALWTKVSM